jgi:hypothetical protein
VNLKRNIKKKFKLAENKRIEKPKTKMKKAINLEDLFKNKKNMSFTQNNVVLKEHYRKKTK